MTKENFINKEGRTVWYYSFETEQPKATVVISHGMAEHPGRYAPLAEFLNKHGYDVRAIVHIGHDSTAERLGHMDRGEFDRCVENIDELVALAKKKTDKVLLIGHSMGSFLSQLYIERHGENIDGCVLSGSTMSADNAKETAAMVNALAQEGDPTQPNYKLIASMFGSYNSRYENVRTDYDWLTRVESVVDAYIADPYSGYTCTLGFYQNMIQGMADMGEESALERIPKALPILIIGGSMDPVSSWGEGLYRLKEKYDALGLCSELIVYDGARHEVFNEVNREQVFRDVLAFLERVG